MGASINERINNPFAARLSKLMEEKRYIQQQLADVIKVKRQTVAQYMDGSIFPRADKLMAIADHFNVSCDYLMGKDACTLPENEEIRKKTGLSDQAIEMLSKLSEQYTEPDCLQDIRGKVTAIDAYNAKMKAGIFEAGTCPKDITAEELSTLKEYSQHVANKENLEMINLLLSEYQGLKIINSMSRYFNVKATDKITMKTDNFIGSIVYDSDTLKSMFAQLTITTMQDFYNTYLNAGNGKE